jgi:hypothetical protein
VALQDRLKKYPSLTLARAVYSFVFVTMVAVGLLTAVLAYSRSSQLLDDAMDVAVRVRTNAAGQNFARALHNDWGNLKFLADEISGSSAQRRTDLMEGMRSNSARISWIGFADTSGRVLQASGDLLVNADLSERPWFRNGLRSPYAGGVRNSVLLAEILPSEDPAGLRFVDLAMPVMDNSGQVIGVVAAYINFAWAQSFLIDQAEIMGLTLYLLGTDGEVILATNGTPPAADETRILLTARSGATAATREVWPDGKSYFSSLVPQIVYRDLPNFGWRMIGRLDGDKVSVSVDSLRGAWIFALFALVSVISLITAAFVMAFIRPIELLGNAADGIADGEDIYPPDINRTRETAQLSSALARLQSSQND